MTVVGLGGGIGATRLWRALAPEVDAQSLTIVVNTADDLWHYGLRVCPDIDTVIYGLAERQNLERGWGLHGDTFTAMSALQDLGESIWFNLGDLDLATHLLRTDLLRRGLSLTGATRSLARANRLETQVLPMCDEDVGTEVHEAGQGWTPFQRFHVEHRAEPAVDAVRYRGIEYARTPTDVASAISAASLVILGPSNPVASMLPILRVGQTTELIRHCAAPVVAITPVVSRRPIGDAGDAHRARSRERLLAAEGIEHNATSVAQLYADFIDVFVLDEADEVEAAAIRALGIEVVVTSTLTHVDPLAAKSLVAELTSRLTPSSGFVHPT